MSQDAQNSQPQSQQQVTNVLTATVHDVRYIAAVLRGLSFSNRANVSISEAGLNVTVDESRTLTASAYIPIAMFEDFTFTLPDIVSTTQHTSASDEVDLQVVFELPLNTLLECLNIFGSASGSAFSSSSSGGGGKGKGKGRWRRGSDDEGSDDGGRGGRGRARWGGSGNGRIDQFFPSTEKGTGMRLSYAGQGHPVTLLLAEDSSGPTTRCEIMTLDSEDITQLDLASDQIALKIILKSSWLVDALSELDPSCDQLTFIGNPSNANTDDLSLNGGAASTARHSAPRSMLRIQAAGVFGSTEMDYPNDRDVLETFDCPHPVKFSYRFAHISRAARALQGSTKTSLRIDESGMLSMQLLMPSPRPRGGQVEAFVEFRCLPIDPDA